MPICDAAAHTLEARRPLPSLAHGLGSTSCLRMSTAPSTLTLSLTCANLGGVLLAGPFAHTQHNTVCLLESFLLFREWRFVFALGSGLLLLCVELAHGFNPCASSNNSDVSSVKVCKYLSPCTKADVPAAESGYTIE